MALETITTCHRDLQEVAIHAHFPFALAGGHVDLRQTIREDVFRQWADLDHILIRLMESHAVRVKVTYLPLRRKEEMCEYMNELLPRVTEKGRIGPTNFAGFVWYL
jgi:hypothetical protein